MENDTFRDFNHFVVAKSLTIAIAVIDALPEDVRAKYAADRDDMVHVLEMMIPRGIDRERFAMEAEKLVGRLPDLTDWTPRE